MRMTYRAEDGAARHDNDKADGDVQSTSRKDELRYESAVLYAAMPMSSASFKGNSSPI